MVQQREFEGKDLDEALRTAAAQLMVAQDELDYEIVEQGRRGVFGLGARAVRIRIVQRDGDRAECTPVDGAAAVTVGPGSADTAEPTNEETSRAAASVVATAQRMLNLMQVRVTARVASLEGGLTLELEGPDQKVLLQKDGEILLALQFLLNRMAIRSWPEVGRIHVTTDIRRRGRDEELIELARQAAREVQRTGRSSTMQPMNAYERRLVHLAVREFPGLASSSLGEGAQKRVTIHPAEDR